MHGGTRPIGALDEDLGQAVEHALGADRAAAAAEALNYSWENCSARFLAGLAVPLAEPELNRKAA
jgi:hypothetical protein